MNSYVNMGVGALLGTVFVLMSVSIASEGIFHSGLPEQEGFAIAAEEDGGADAGGGEAAAAVPIATLLASADASAGETVFKKCASCHTTESGGPNKVGPNLWDIVNRPIASHEGFSYSGAMTTFSEGHTVVWDFDHLNYFLEAPKKHVPGTAMGFVGIKKDDERANLLAYLHTLSDNPAPMPAAPTEGAAVDEGTAPADNGAAAASGEETAPATEGTAAEPQQAAPAEEAAPAEGGAAAAPEEAAPTEGDTPAAAEEAAPADEGAAAPEQPEAQ